MGVRGVFATPHPSGGGSDFCGANQNTNIDARCMISALLANWLPMKLRIRYRSSDDEVTERDISEITVESPRTIQAMCHLRGEKRSFVLERIESAINLDTSEVIDDLGTFFGLHPINTPRLSRPVFHERPTPLPIEDAQRQRKKDKADLYKPFKAPVIAELAKRRLYALFDNRCFNCGSTSRLQIDHHIPQFLGGRLLPGNLVILCSRCNSAKRDAHPEQFYSQEQLRTVESLLDAQLEIFNFKFDWTRWNGHRDQYLLSLGASPEFVTEVMTDELSPFYSGQATNESDGVVITISISDALDGFLERLQLKD